MRYIATVILLLPAAAVPACAQDLVWPVSGPVTQTFYGTFSGKSSGYYYDENHTLLYFDYTGADGRHRAIDIGAPTGAPVVAARSGIAISYPDTGGGYGNHIVLDHGSGYFTLYGHLSAIGVSTGQAVATGDYIGQVGATGNVTGPHLHFEVRYSSVGGPWSYSIPRYYIPSMDGDSVGAGLDIVFDYPLIGSSASGGGRDNPNGDRSINDQCVAAVGGDGAGSHPGTIAALAAALLALRLRRRTRLR